MEYVAANFPEPTDASLLWSSSRLTVLMPQSVDNSDLRLCKRLTQTDISTLLVLGTFTSIPELPSVWKTCVSSTDPILLPNLVHRKIVHLQQWWVCQPLRKICWAFQRCFWKILSERIPRSSGFLCDLIFFRVEQILCLWITASIVSWFGSSRKFPSAVKSLTVCMPSILKRWCCY